ncbi:HrgA protein [Campylobacter jejuni]|nr:HrgA protein [Campylobacter jejuni]
MSSKLSYKELTLEILKQSDRPLSVNEIWQKALEQGLDKKLSSIRQTPIATLGARIYVDIKECNTILYLSKLLKNLQLFG